MTQKAKFYGKEIDLDQATFFSSPVPPQFELKKCIRVSASRANNKAIQVAFEDEDLLAIQFTDNTEWIGHPAAVQELYDQNTLQKRSIIDETYLFEARIATAESTRGTIKRALIKVFGIFGTKDIAQVGMKQLGTAYDKKVQPSPGLYQLDANFNKGKVKNNEQSKPYLLFIHGTLSTTLDAFGDLREGSHWERIVQQYGKNMLALEHHTLSVSPLKNALDFLKACPNEIVLDIVSHSRGGLVADILAKCDYGNTKSQAVGFSKNELVIVKKGDPVSHKLMLQINRELIKKQIYVRKVVRVAAPASGTTILSRRIDHFFNLLLNAISFAFGVRNPLYGIVKSFLMELISQKEDPEILAGLNSMMPESLFQKMMNAADTAVVSDLYAISGDSEVGGITFDSLKVILANLFYREANDLVIDTRRMLHGVPRVNGSYAYLSRDKNTNHFNYFKNQNSCEAIFEALTDKKGPAKYFEKHVLTAGERGVLLDLFSLDGVNYSPEKTTRDLVIVIPGIMGSTLGTGAEDFWVQMRALNKGAIVDHLKTDNTKIKASGVVKKFYDKFCHYLLKDYDVLTLAFDWRKSLEEAATQLRKELEKQLKSHDHTIHIVAHSMGGLVVRECMRLYSDTWAQFSQRKKNKFVMLGTPWLGSYLIMEVLTGHSGRVKQLAAIDFENDRADLLKVFWDYPGVFELLPIEQSGKRAFWTSDFWKELNGKSNLKHLPDITNHKELLSHFENYRTNILKFLSSIKDDQEFFKNVYYICGKADETVFNYRFKDRFLSAYKKLVYLGTSKGDGSVTWQTGVPQQLVGGPNLYYTHTTHGDLANEGYIFEGIHDILARGKTNRLSTQPPISRGPSAITEIHSNVEPLTDSNAVVTALFDTRKPAVPKAEEIHVTVINGDLKVASYPVMVGHFFMDLILSAEKALDGYLNNRLTQRLNIGYYPGKIGESEVFFNLNTQPKGAIVCGLGSTDTLTSFLLSKTVELAVLKYAMFMRDNYTLPKAKQYADGISFILIGIGYGKLPIEDSLKGILLGVSAANRYINETGEGLKVIKKIEVLNYYESVASQAYFSLSRMRDQDKRISIRLDKGVIRRVGAKKKRLFSDNGYNWWYTLQIESVLDEKQQGVCGYRYYSTRALARVEQEIIGIGNRTVDRLLEIHSKTSVWDRRLSKALFEMLVPNNFKDVFRNQGNMVLKLDTKAAEIPWELLHDSNTDETPISVSSTFIRQLVTSNGKSFEQVSLSNNGVLVIGDPDYRQDELPQLPAAAAEAEWVTGQFQANGFKTASLIGETADAIMIQLYDREYKIMHFAGHGVYEPENQNVGIAIGDGICIDPSKIKQIGYTPEFVFINCCYSGTMNAQDDRYSQQRYRLAANVGTELIEMGVKAIIISGWAVDDAAAKTFAETFYKKMFEGYNFGTSVQKARLACYQGHPGTNTWGAYQCYGNQFYKLKSTQKSKREELEYVIASQVHTDMDNLLIAIRDRKHDTKTTLKKLDKYMDKAEQANLLDAVVLEKEALIYDELGKPEIALEKFVALFKYANGNFSIEALEQYCVIKTYNLKKATLKDDLKEIEFLTMVGKNPSRLNIVANAYKFASMQTTTKRERVSYLKKAYSFYEKGYLASIDPYDGHCLDAMTNMIFVAYILQLNDPKNEDVLTRLQQCSAFSEVSDLPTYLTNFHKELDEFDQANLDVSVLIGMAEVKYGLMLLQNDFSPNPEIDIIKKFNHIFELLYSPRYIRIELLQIDFLLYHIKDKVIRQQLNKVKEAIQKLMEN